MLLVPAEAARMVTKSPNMQGCRHGEAGRLVRGEDQALYASGIGGLHSRSRKGDSQNCLPECTTPGGRSDAYTVPQPNLRVEPVITPEASKLHPDQATSGLRTRMPGMQELLELCGMSPLGMLSG